MQTDDVNQAGVNALNRDGGVGEQIWDGVSGGGHVRVPEHNEGGVAGHVYELDRRLERDGAGALRADERFGKVAAIFGQQVFEGIARDLAVELAHFRAGEWHDFLGEVREPGHGRQVLSGGEAAAQAVDDVHGDDVVGGAPISQGAGSARVVAYHSGERAAVLR